jgi:8-oxo-dGTP pyrophosphatase MutT (NUDIX family)
MKEITLTLLYLVKESQVLLALKKRGFGEGRYNGVGGKLKQNETVEQALVRECEEEIGITPNDFDKMAEITFDEYMNGESTIAHVHIYTSKDWNGEPSESEEMSPKWFDNDKLPFEIMWPNDTYWLPQVLEGKKLIGHFKLDKNDLVLSHDVKIVQKL